MIYQNIITIAEQTQVHHPHTVCLNNIITYGLWSSHTESTSSHEITKGLMSVVSTEMGDH